MNFELIVSLNYNYKSAIMELVTPHPDIAYILLNINKSIMDIKNKII